MDINRVLITAGPTWVAIDRVRVISNISSGETGFLLAKKFSELGMRVTLLLGPVEQPVSGRGFKLIRFRFFDELREGLLKELKTRKYDIVIHTAAVSDYKPKRIISRKISSGKKRFKLELTPTPKLISLIKKSDPGVFLVGFKFEPASARGYLLRKARNLIRDSKLNLAVANSIDNRGYRAYIVEKERFTGPYKNKNEMVKKLVKQLTEKICRN